MSQICRNCGHEEASDDAIVCSECLSELDCLINEKEAARKKEIANMGKKALFFSIFSAVAGIVMAVYIKFVQLDAELFTVLVPAIIWLAVSALGILYALRSFGGEKKSAGIGAIVISAVQLAAVPVISSIIMGFLKF